MYSTNAAGIYSRWEEGGEPRSLCAGTPYGDKRLRAQELRLLLGAPFWKVKHIEQIYNNCGAQIARQFPHHKEGHEKEKPEKQIALVELLKNKFLVVQQPEIEHIHDSGEPF